MIHSSYNKLCIIAGLHDGDANQVNGARLVRENYTQQHGTQLKHDLSRSNDVRFI